MLTRRKLMIVAAALVLGAAVGGQVSGQAEALLQKAIQAETVDGNLKAAIGLYEQAVAAAGSNRSVAARALVEMGECYEKLGSAEAQKAYQRVVRDFADQAEPLKLARSRLAALTLATAEDSGIVTRQVWSGHDVEFSGRPSPDGRYLSYSHGTGNLAIREVATGETRQLTKDASLWTAEGWAGWSLFSPDGRQVVYEWGQWDSWLRLSSADGAQTRILLPAKRDWWIVPCDWSSDGRYILIHYYPADERQSSQIAIVTVADGSLHVVKTLDPGQPFNSRNMWFSPDGRYIVYDVLPQGAQNNRDLAILSVDGTLETPLVENPADDYVVGWSPDGRSVVFASNRSGAYGVWEIPVSKGRPDGEARLLKRDSGPIRPLGFTRNGTLFYGQAGAMGVELDVYGMNIDLAQGSLGQARLAVQNFRGLNSSPDWSPAGRYLAYVSGRPDSKTYVVCIRDETTGAVREIHPAAIEMSRFSIRWSPDGRSFLAEGQDREKRDGLFLVDAKTGDVTPLFPRDRTVTGAFFDAQWMPDSRRIVYATGSRRPEVISRIVVLDTETGHEQEILRMTDLRLIGFLALSPDGSRLAFAAYRLTGGTDGGGIKNCTLTVIPASGGETTELLQVSFPELINSLAWSHDSRSIIFARANVGGQASQLQEAGQPVWQIPAAGGEPRRLGVVPGLGPRGRLSLHPDGRRIVYSRGERRYDIWAMENLLPKPSESR